MLAVRFYDAMVALHVMAIVIAFGVTFAYPIMGPFFATRYPESMPALHEVQERIGKLLITPAAVVALLLGAYLATDAEVWDEVWVTVPLVILIVLLGLGGAFFSPSERKATELARRDLAASTGEGPVAWSPEYQAITKRVAMVGTLANLLILIAIYFMVAKPFA